MISFDLLILFTAETTGTVGETVCNVIGELSKLLAGLVQGGGLLDLLGNILPLDVLGSVL